MRKRCTFNDLQEGDTVYRINAKGEVNKLVVSNVMPAHRELLTYGGDSIFIPTKSNWYESIGSGYEEENGNKFLYYVPDKLDTTTTDICNCWGDERLNPMTPLFSKSIISTPHSINFSDDLFQIQIDGIVTKDESVEVFFSRGIKGRGNKIIRTEVTDIENPGAYAITEIKINSNIEYHIASLTQECLNRAVREVLKDLLDENLSKINQLENFAIKIQSKINSYEELGKWNYEDISKSD